MKPYPADFRDRVLRAWDAGLARGEATRTVGVTERTVRRWQRQGRETGSVAPTRRVGSPRRIGPAQEDALLTQVRAQPDATVAEHGATWEATHGVRRSAATMWRVEAAGLAAPKKSLITTQRDEPGRTAWRAAVAALAPATCVVVDESGANTAMTRRGGRRRGGNARWARSRATTVPPARSLRR